MVIKKNKAIKEELIKRKEELEQELNELSSQHNPDSTAPDPLDQAASASIEELAISLEEQVHDEYERILKAIEMVDEGTYGVCIECGGPIESKRLSLYPDSTRCLYCQRLTEEKVC